MQIYTNNAGISLPLAVFLASDDYDYESGVISVTSLMRPIRQLILGYRVPREENPVDVSALVASRMGSAIHTAIEKAWLTNKDKALADLGYPQHIIDRVLVNPTDEELAAVVNPITVYMEQRAYKEIMGYKISGKFDFVAEGRVEDFKSTSVYNYINQSNAKKYPIQGSLYRWLSPHIITKDFMKIHYVFTDWSKVDALSRPNYPPQRVMTQEFKLMSLEETERYVMSRLALINKYRDEDEINIPHCTDEELWRKPASWKYYKDPNKTSGRSTKNFDNATDAFARFRDDGGTGVVLEVKGQVSACKYCNAFNICTQKDQLIVSGDLVL